MTTTPSDDEIDASDAAYDLIPLGAPDAWGDLESWLEAVDRFGVATGCS